MTPVRLRLTTPARPKERKGGRKGRKEHAFGIPGSLRRLKNRHEGKGSDPRDAGFVDCYREDVLVVSAVLTPCQHFHYFNHDVLVCWGEVERRGTREESDQRGEQAAGVRTEGSRCTRCS